MKGESPADAHTPILIIEDDEAVRGAIAEALTDEGYPVTEAANGAEALDLLRSGVRPCVILLDLWMPHLGGEAFRMAQLQVDEWAEIPVVVVSAAADCGALASALSAASYLRKPLDLDQLLATVARLC